MFVGTFCRWSGFCLEILDLVPVVGGLFKLEVVGGHPAFGQRISSSAQMGYEFHILKVYVTSASPVSTSPPNIQIKRWSGTSLSWFPIMG